MLDLYKLQIFSVVIQEGSFSAAAEHLFMTQSAVSQHIKELEQQLGQQLFQRGWRGVKPTAHGNILYRYTTEIFALVAKAENAVTDVNHLAEGRISIGATPGISMYLVPNWVQNFRMQYPQLTVATQTGVTSKILKDVLAHRIEIGFIEGELADNQSTRLSSLVLEEIEQQVVVGAKHPFFKLDKLTIEDLHEQPIIMRQTTSQSRIWLEQILHKYAIDPVIASEFDNLESIKRTVSVSTSLTILPPYVVQSEVNQGILHIIPIEGKPLMRSLKLIWASDVHFSPIANAFLRELSQSFSMVNELLNQDGH
jgi:LysR family transcriptional regulator, low CO2-responsive transcriptional regulator